MRLVYSISSGVFTLEICNSDGVNLHCISKAKYKVGHTVKSRLAEWLKPTFHTKFRKGFSDKHEAIYKQKISEKYDVVKELKANS